MKASSDPSRRLQKPFMSSKSLQGAFMQRRSLHEGNWGVCFCVWCGLCVIGAVCAAVGRGCVCCELRAELTGHTAPRTHGTQAFARCGPQQTPQPTEHTAPKTPDPQQSRAHSSRSTNSAKRTHSFRNTRSPRRTQPARTHAHRSHRAHSSLWTVCSVVCDAGHSLCRGEIFMRSSKRAEAFMKALGNLHEDGKPSSKLQGSFMKRSSRQESSGELS